MPSSAVGTGLGAVQGVKAPKGLRARGRAFSQGRGRCGRCGVDLGKLEGVPHQAVCPERPRHETEGGRRFHLRFETDDPIYWLDLEVDARATLLDLDRWLRRLWLDCPEQVAPDDEVPRASGCRGHRSVWEIWGVGYPIDPPRRELGGQSTPGDSSAIRGRRLDLEVELAEPLRPGVRLQVLYDLHAPTQLRGQVLDERVLDARWIEETGRCEVLVRNRVPRWSCSVCGALASWVCARCRGQRPSLVCSDHRVAHGVANGCDGRWLWPIANSPRMGCCSDAGRG